MQCLRTRRLIHLAAPWIPALLCIAATACAPASSAGDAPDASNDAVAASPGADASASSSTGDAHAAALDGSDAAPSPAPDPWADQPAGPAVSFDPNGQGFFDFPFPSDLRRAADGAVDWSGFPNPKGIDLIARYVEAAQTEVDGFSTTGTVYFKLDGPVDETRLPAPLDSTSDDSTVWCLDVSDSSAHFGERHAVEVDVFEGSDSPYMPAHLLRVRPLPGLPLREGGRYAVVVRRGLLDPQGRPLAPAPGLREYLAGDDEALPDDLAALLAPLRALVQQGELAPYDVAAATVFTVQTGTGELAAIHDFVASKPAPTPVQWKLLDDKGTYWLFEARYTAPNFQQGAKPYDTEGGNIAFDASGTPLVAEDEPMRLALAVPPGPPPPGGWPVVLYAHGTGGDYLSFTWNKNMSPAAQLTGQKLAVLSTDEPLHGIRYDGPGDLELLSFNAANPDAFRSNFRQAAIDFITLTHMVLAGVEVPATVTPNGQPIGLATEPICFMGHSHGALSGAMLVAVEPHLRAAVLSASGGGISETLMLRKDPLDIRAFIAQLTGEPIEQLDARHPVVTLVQTLVDITDPINYAPAWVDGAMRDGTALSILLTIGLEDPYTPPITAESLAAAARIAVVAPALEWSPGMLAAGVEELPAPIVANVTSATGQQATAALFQAAGYGHYLVFENADAAQRYAGFLQSAAHAFPKIP